ncbi:hypothetical protein SAMN05192559_1075 [Halobacillus karajensis]|uniref:hypothetical protein n=1 Tax=Halobacillus karajensis TaxID=195088 RepID=UPI0008A7F6A9|nr:hypothetical protein [Halobacillus karajensis]SEH99982.1 hypothetical protein SAMN05192559_1075 [Halobacillus karajensis]
MYGVTYFYALAAIGLIFLIPYLSIRDFKRGRKISSIFTSIAMLVILLFVALGEVLKTFLAEASMVYYNQIFFLGVVVIIVVPLILLIFFTVKKSIKSGRIRRNINTSGYTKLDTFC